MKIVFATFMLAVAPSIVMCQEHHVKLRSEQGGIQLLSNLTNIVMPSTAPANRGCIAHSGDDAQVLYQMAGIESEAVWVRIKMSSGPCVGEEGWVSTENVRLN